jgi:tripartite-type tricarboxylate transporter receptor subunit TctC
MKTWILRCIAALTSLGAAAAFAQSYPSKPITIVVPFTAGGSTDVITRAVATKLRAALKQEVIVDNRPGAASLVALNYVRSQPADGYTLVLMSTTITTLPALNSNAKYTIEKDFTPVAGVGKGVMLLVAHADTGINNMAELLAQAKASPGKLNWGLASTLGFDHLGAMGIMREAGVKIETVGYKGDSPLTLDLVANRVQLALGAPGVFGPHIQAGKLRPIAVASAVRWPDLPSVPTLVEAGFKESTIEPWFGTFGPGGMPREVVAVLNREISAAVQTPEVAGQLAQIGWRPMPLNVAQMTDLALSSERNWSQVIKAMGIKPE